MDPQILFNQFLSSLQASNGNLELTVPALSGLRLVSENQQLPQVGDPQSQEPPANPEKKPKGKKICPYWYHGGCTKSSSDCKNLHQVEGSCGVLSWRVARTHGPPCGLELCPYKDSLPSKQKAPAPSPDPQDTSAKAATSNKRKRRDSKTDASDHVDDEVQQRKFPFRHYDKPYTVKPVAMDYDDVSPDEGKLEMCFYWYHGYCSRAETAARGLAPSCPFKHELVESAVVHLPPKIWNHPETCDRDLCPVVKAKTQTPLQPSPRKTSSSSVESGGKKSSNRKPKAVDETCFFWYHGHCGRAADTRNPHGCNYKHELTDPPSMVQPPPGYKHRVPCTRDWCPGDAREESSKMGQVLGQGDEVTAGDGEGREEWFLEGFD